MVKNVFLGKILLVPSFGFPWVTKTRVSHKAPNLFCWLSFLIEQKSTACGAEMNWKLWCEAAWRQAWKNKGIHQPTQIHMVWTQNVWELLGWVLRTKGERRSKKQKQNHGRHSLNFSTYACTYICIYTFMCACMFKLCKCTHAHTCRRRTTCLSQLPG